MLSNLLTRPPQVAVTLEDDKDILILHPSVNPAEPSQDPIIRGTAQLTLSAPRPVTKLKVVFEGLQDCFGGVGYPYASNVTLHKELDFDLKGEILGKGTHAWEWSFIVPSTTTSHQRCNYGRVRHYIKAKFEFPGSFQNTATSAPVGIMIHHNSNPPGEPAYCQIHMQHDSDDLGPTSVLFSSPHLTIASLLSMRLDVLAPNKNSTIKSVTGVIEQTFVVSFEDPNLISTPPTERHVLPKVRPALPPGWMTRESSASSTPSTPPLVSRRQPGVHERSPSRSKSRGLKGKGKEKEDIFSSNRFKFPGIEGDLLLEDEEPLKELAAGEEWSYARILRVPDSNYMRPTTLEIAEGRIRASHVLAVEVRYRLEGETSDKMLRLKKPFILTPCCCLQEILPGYSTSVPNEVLGAAPVKCMCYVPLREMVDRDGEQLQRAGEISTDTTPEDSTLSAARLAKTPAVTQGSNWRGRRRSGGAADGPNGSAFA